MVRQNLRRRSVGSRLMHEALAFLKAQGVGNFTVYTALNYQAGLQFHADEGMTPLLVNLLGSTGS